MAGVTRFARYPVSEFRWIFRRRWVSLRTFSGELTFPSQVQSLRRSFLAYFVKYLLTFKKIKRMKRPSRCEHRNLHTTVTPFPGAISPGKTDRYAVLPPGACTCRVFSDSQF